MLAEMFIVMMRIDPELTIVALAVVPLLAALIATASNQIDRIAGAARAQGEPHSTPWPIARSPRSE